MDIVTGWRERVSDYRLGYQLSKRKPLSAYISYVYTCKSDFASGLENECSKIIWPSDKIGETLGQDIRTSLVQAQMLLIHMERGLHLVKDLP